ncbi:MAG: hypothetical protein NTX53_12205 [candidate division WOR-3 bacterium]|nr:hypothetical protein [candidate division WOR-3 bacterium]
MQKNSAVGSIEKGLQPDWAFDMLGTSLFWRTKADELDRMVRLGYMAWREDIEAIRAYTTDPERGTLEHRPSTLTVAFFLAAVAIENLLKANFVVEHPECISKGKFRGDVITNHDLCEIAREARIDLESDERDFCELGSEAIGSFGRYHIGKNSTDSPNGYTVKDSAFPIYERLYARLRKRIETQPWKKPAAGQPPAPQLAPRRGA